MSLCPVGRHWQARRRTAFGLPSLLPRWLSDLTRFLVERRYRCADLDPINALLLREDVVCAMGDEYHPSLWSERRGMRERQQRR